MDVIIFSGQSNMQGSTGQKGCSKAKNCLEYKFLTDEFVGVKDPVGENIGEDLLCKFVRRAKMSCGHFIGRLERSKSLPQPETANLSQTVVCLALNKGQKPRNHKTIN